jgi:hypothetical protein
MANSRGGAPGRVVALSILAGVFAVARPASGQG